MAIPSIPEIQKAVRNQAGFGRQVVPSGPTLNAPSIRAAADLTADNLLSESTNTETTYSLSNRLALRETSDWKSVRRIALNTLEQDNGFAINSTSEPLTKGTLTGLGPRNDIGASGRNSTGTGDS